MLLVLFSNNLEIAIFLFDLVVIKSVKVCLETIFDLHKDIKDIFLTTDYWSPKAYSLNVKRVKWLLFKRVKSVRTTLTEWKSLSKWVKIIPKRVKITPKRVRITPKEWLSLFGGAQRGTARNKRAVPLWASPKSEIHSIGVIFTLFWVIFTHFGMIFTRFKSNFHPVRVVFTLFSLLKSNHFTFLH